MKLTLEKTVFMDEFCASPDWQLSIDDKKKDIMVYSKIGGSGVNCVKSVGIVDHPAEHIFKLLIDNKYRALYNDVLNDTEEQLMVLGAQTLAVH
jgi:hypothetical protein